MLWCFQFGELVSWPKCWAMPVLGGRSKGRKGRGKGETHWKHRAGGSYWKSWVPCGTMVAGSKKTLEWWPGSLTSDVTRVQRAAAGLILVVLLWFIPTEDLVQCPLKICYCASEEQSHIGGVCSVCCRAWWIQTKLDVYSSPGCSSFSPRSKLLVF